MASSHHVVVIGGGFGGIQAVQKLRRAPVQVTLVDRRNFHLFQPLNYQVATGGLTTAEVAYPLRAVFRRSPNVRVLLAEADGFDLDARQVRLRSAVDGSEVAPLSYDSLIVAAGSHYSYFGHDEWQEFAPDVKSLESALLVRQRILRAFEAAELESDPERRIPWLTFVVVGAGPTGVEMAGQIGEIARDTLPRDFGEIDPRQARILLAEAGDRILPAFPPSLSRSAARSLQALGVTPLVERPVVGIDDESVTFGGSDGATERVQARTVVWAAGVTASRLAGQLAEQTGAELDRAGRITVEPALTLPGRPEVLAIGDMVRVRQTDGTVLTLPGVSPVAMQQGRHAARVILDRLEGRAAKPFKYNNKGDLATIGRARAVAVVKGIRFSGFPAWVVWLVVHLFYLIGFQNRLLVLIRWAFAFFSRQRGARLITGAPSERG
jgi:NADH dehydrogenase